MAVEPKPLASREVYFDWADQIETGKEARYGGGIRLFPDKVVVTGRIREELPWYCMFGAVGALIGSLLGAAICDDASKKIEIVFSPSAGQLRRSKDPTVFRLETESGKWLFCQSGLPPGPKYEQFVRVLERLYEGRISRD